MRLRVLMLLLACVPVARAQTTAAITADDLRARLSAFAHDSMEGRATATRGHARATTYIANELRRLALTPKGEAGSFFQDLPLVAGEIRQDFVRLTLQTVRPGARNETVIGETAFRYGVEFVPVPNIGGIAFPSVARAYQRPIVMGGRFGEGASAEGGTSIGFGTPKEVGDLDQRIVVVDAPLRSNGQPDYQLWRDPEQLLAYRGASVVLVAALDVTPRTVIDRFMQPWIGLPPRTPPYQAPPVVLITRATAMLFRASGGLAASASFEALKRAVAEPSSNVIAMVEGSDPQLKSEFVVLSAHTDHLGVAPAGGAAADSVFNGVNAGSGAMALLEIAEHIASLDVKPKRSVLFVWTAASEQGVLGSQWFAEHPTVDRGNIVANINVDLIGRAPLGDITQAEFGAPESMTPCSGDQWPLARLGIPSVTITAGSFRDDRGVAEDAGRIDYEAYATNVRRIAALAADVAGRSRMPRLKGNPDAVCM